MLDAENKVQIIVVLDDHTRTHLGGWNGHSKVSLLTLVAVKVQSAGRSLRIIAMPSLRALIYANVLGEPENSISKLIILSYPSGFWQPSVGLTSSISRTF